MEKGDRIQLDFTPDPFTRLKSGDQGTVRRVDDSGTVQVDWDSGSTLGLVPDEDRWHVVEDEEAYENCPDCGGSGKRQIPIMNDWDEIEEWIERVCSFCGGSGKFFADQAAELKAEGVWYDK